MSDGKGLDIRIEPMRATDLDAVKQKLKNLGYL